MANNVTGKIVGGESKAFDEMTTVGEIRVAIKADATAQATVNGKSVDDEYAVRDYDFVSFSKNVKGGYILRRSVTVRIK